MPGDAHLDHESNLMELTAETVQALTDLVRQEMELARTEIVAEFKRAVRAGVAFGAGGVAAGLAVLFAALAAAGALSLVVPVWAGLLVVAALFGAPALLLLATAGLEAKRYHALPKRTVDTVKEDVKWITTRVPRS